MENQCNLSLSEETHKHENDILLLSKGILIRIFKRAL